MWRRNSDLGLGLDLAGERERERERARFTGLLGDFLAAAGAASAAGAAATAAAARVGVVAAAAAAGLIAAFAGGGVDGSRLKAGARLGASLLRSRMRVAVRGVRGVFFILLLGLVALASCCFVFFTAVWLGAARSASLLRFLGGVAGSIVCGRG